MSVNGSLSLYRKDDGPERRAFHGGRHFSSFGLLVVAKGTARHPLFTEVSIMTEKEFFELGDTVCTVVFIVAILVWIVVEYDLY